MDFVILALAAWRISSLLAHESGPFDMFAKLRSIVGVEVDGLGRNGTGVLSNLIICVWCTSVWLGLFAALLYYFLPVATVAVALVFAISAGAILVEETLDKLMMRD